LYAGFYKYSQNPANIEKSIEYYHQLTQEYPGTSLAGKAEKALPRLNQSAPPAEVSNIRHWAYPDYTRVVLDLNRFVPFKTQNKKNKELTLEINPARLSANARKKLKSLDDGLLRLVEVRETEKNLVRVKIETQGLAQPPKVLALSHPSRLVLDLYPGSPKGSSQGDKTGLKAEAYSFKIGAIILDPGHGGKDPGALGKSGLTEKEVVLDIAFRLRKLISDNLGKKVIMTRTRDEFISLEKRTQIANSNKADLFVSIHANSHPKRSTRGIEIYHLGQSSDKRARAVAARENNVSLEDLGSLDKSVKQILFDLDREYNSTQSQDLAHFTHQSFKDTLKNQFKYRLVDLGVKRAP
ncbi:MAG TPA: N-acetylmuramoyl-L-alanine amidase, partial [Nitrospiria bacterium]|nr:N-acetylmuramoyl-L-alanine amidase [Nitrospiria bacterium]